MKVGGKPVPTGVGFFFIAFGVLCAVFLMPGAKESHSPFLYVCIFGGLFVGVPAILGVAVVRENLRNKSRSQTLTRSLIRNSYLKSTSPVTALERSRPAADATREALGAVIASRLRYKCGS